MIELLERHRSQLHDLCRTYHVKSLEVFGSATDSSWNSRDSDLDFLVEFEPLEPGQTFDCFFDLKDSLQVLFGRKVDLVIPRAIRNPYFLESVNRSRRVLFLA